jgi:hypothetical protein
MSNDTTNVTWTTPQPTEPPDALYQMRLALTGTHLLLVAVGLVNLLVVVVILVKPYMRTITNVYMISLCLADFLYLINLTMVAATQLNNKSWMFGGVLCTVYHGSETTGKYASVAFVVLLAIDRYCAMCRADLCARYRSYRCALTASAIAWTLALAAASPLFAFAELMELPRRGVHALLCIAKWPSGESARWYIIFSSVLIFALPLGVIIFCYYHILGRLRDAVKGSRRLHRAPSSRAPYHRVTRLVLWVVVFHVICWSPFWLFNLFSSISRMQISTRTDRIIVNIIHLFPYVNCALNPLLYAVHAENFRTAFKSLLCNALGGTLRTSTSTSSLSKHSRAPPRTGSCRVQAPECNASSSSYRKRRSHSVLKLADNNNHLHNSHHVGSIAHCSSNSLKLPFDATDV